MNWLRKLWNKPGPGDASPAPAALPLSAPSVEPTAFISDIHGNLQALEAVLADIGAQGVREIVCLGDLVGYGGNPAECVDLVRGADIPCIRGNHDAYAGRTTEWMPRSAEFESVCARMREQVGEERCRWLGNLPLTFGGEDFEAVHATLYHPDRWNYLDHISVVDEHFRHQVKPVCFVGHTHLPAMWVEGMDRPGNDFGIESLRVGRRQVVNVGSVGQPRDGEPKACYLIYRRKERDVWWRRVAYDIEGAQRSIAMAGLPWRYAARLESGE